MKQDFWKEKYLKQATGWDVGCISLPLKTYFDQLKSKDLRILIPAAGNAYEAEYLYQNGFLNIDILDFVEEPLHSLKSRIPGIPDNQLLLKDFFSHEGQYDLIVEQTFFCALDRSKRTEYVKKCHSLLKPNGKLIGLLFASEFPASDTPPFGGTMESYKQLFAPYFQIKEMESCYNSIPARSGNEIFINLIKRNL